MSQPPVIEDLHLAFQMAPVGLLVSRNRLIELHNSAFGEMFACGAEDLLGQSLEILYGSRGEFDHIGERAFDQMKITGVYSDERIMRKRDGSLFWCHVSGRALDRSDPFAAAVWAFEDLSSSRNLNVSLTPREREIAQFLVLGKSSKHIAAELRIGPRTVEAYRARLMRKYDAASITELILKLLGGR